jgi:hypothetical protein
VEVNAMIVYFETWYGPAGRHTWNRSKIWCNGWYHILIWFAHNAIPGQYSLCTFVLRWELLNTGNRRWELLNTTIDVKLRSFNKGGVCRIHPFASGAQMRNKSIVCVASTIFAAKLERKICRT